MESRVSGPGQRTRLRGRARERALLDELLVAVRRGESRSLVLRGEAGIGKTALLRYLVDSAPDLTVLRAEGVESEMELGFSSLHQLCAPLLDRLERLPDPQRKALEIVFGLSSGPPPNRFLVGLGALSLLSEAAEEHPLLCVVDDAQWLDRFSALALAFVARRLLAEPVGIVFAARQPGEELQNLSLLEVQGLGNGDARALLGVAVRTKLDDGIRDRIIAETRGNPLALLELPRGLTMTQLAGGFGLLGGQPLSEQIEQSFVRQFEGLPDGARRLLLVAAAEPVGDPLLLWRAAERLGIPPTAGDTVEAQRLLTIDERVTFRHPLVRAAVYRSAAVEDRRAAHLGLADATDQDADPDRHAWHLAWATPGPDERVAAQLERSAGQAQARGGLAATAAFLQRAAALSSDSSRRAGRLLAAAGATRDAGALDLALTLLSAVQTETLDDLGRARADTLAGQIAFEQLRCREAAELLSDAARRLESDDVALARTTHLEALGAAMWVGDRGGPTGTLAIAEAAKSAPAPLGPRTVTDALLDGFASLVTDGYAVAALSLCRALERVLGPRPAADDHQHWGWFAVAGNAMTVAQELWDAGSWRVVTGRHEEFARETGALVHLQFALNMLAWVHVLEGELTKSARLLEENRTIAAATGNPPITYSEIVIAAWRGEEARGTELIEATARDATTRGLRRFEAFAAYASAVLHNGLGRHAEARDDVLSAFDEDHAGFGPFVVPELAEAAARTGDTALLSSALDWLVERTRLTPTEWSRGIEKRIRALMSDGELAGHLYEASIEHLRRTPVRVEIARGRLLYGAWLRRHGRRVDAREQLRASYEMLSTMGIDAFAERARRELLATGETVRKRTVETRDDLTAQERQIAELARDGLSNAEIGARLFLSPRTVEWHLRKVFTKLGIRSRRELANVLSESDAGLVPA